MLEKESFWREVRDNVPAYSKFLAQEKGCEYQPESFDELPFQTKQNYLLQFPMKDLCRPDDVMNIHLIGASSGFSKSGAVYWPKRPQDEVGYIQSIETMLRTYYQIDKKRTLTFVCLAFGMWIGGMQIASTMRQIALNGNYPFTVCTPGLNLKEIAHVLKQYEADFDQFLIVTNPSNIPLIVNLLKQEKVSVKPGSVSFPVVGEYFTETFREQIARSFGHPEDSPYVVWTGYGSADAGDLGYENASVIALRKFMARMPDLSEKFFGTTSTPMILQLNPSALIEIVDGRIVVTKDQLTPLLRYDTKDNGGLLERSDLKGYIPSPLYDLLPEHMMFVYGRVDNAIVFYGTNLVINNIVDYMLSLPTELCYGGLFTVQEKNIDGITTFLFTIYVTHPEKVIIEDYRKYLIDFLCRQSDEFRIKYENLSQSVSLPLIELAIADIDSVNSKIKHKYILS